MTAVIGKMNAGFFNEADENRRETSCEICDVAKSEGNVPNRISVCTKKMRPEEDASSPEGKSGLKFVRQFLERIAEQLVGDGGGIKEPLKFRPRQTLATEIYHQRGNRDSQEQTEHHVFLHGSSSTGCGMLRKKIPLFNENEAPLEKKGGTNCLPGGITC